MFILTQTLLKQKPSTSVISVTKADERFIRVEACGHVRKAQSSSHNVKRNRYIKPEFEKRLFFKRLRSVNDQHS